MTNDKKKFLNLNGVNIPTFFYGTAWKEDDTERFTTQALNLGLRAIDTANQRKHYYEAGVGKALKAALKTGQLKREDLFLQTKFTYVHGQDHRLPYDQNAPMAKQVEQSFASSLEHLGVEYIDSYVLHGPEMRMGLTPNDWSTWRAMEGLLQSGKAKFLGISNVSSGQLAELLEKATIKPAFVQNRCYPSIQWDRATRDLCLKANIQYQGFSLIRDPKIFAAQEVMALADRIKKTPQQIIYRWALQSQMIVLIGCTTGRHLEEAFEAYDFCLDDSAMAMIDNL